MTMSTIILVYSYLFIGFIEHKSKYFTRQTAYSFLSAQVTMEYPVLLPVPYIITFYLLLSYERFTYKIYVDGIGLTDL